MLANVELSQITYDAHSNALLVSIAIPSYNSARHIRACLRAVFAQNTQAPFEVILVDSSDDGTDQIVAAEFPQVRLFHFQERRSVGTARNIGIEKAQGEVILFLDTDCIANPRWLDQMYAAMQDLNADGVGGSMENGTPGSLSGSVGFYLEFFRFLAYDGQPCPTPFLVGGNCGFKREVFQTARYTDRSIGDDLMFNWQLASRGKKLVFVPFASVKHVNKTGWERVLRYQYQLGRGACAYRRVMSPKIMRVLDRLPILAFLLPAGVLPWIAATVFRRWGVFQFFKLVALLPLMLVANGVWAAGFYRELVSHAAEAKVRYNTRA